MFGNSSLPGRLRDGVQQQTRAAPDHAPVLREAKQVSRELAWLATRQNLAQAGWGHGPRPAKSWWGQRGDVRGIMTNSRQHRRTKDSGRDRGHQQEVR